MKKKLWRISAALCLGFLALKGPEALAANQVLYRLYNQTSGEHFFTIDQNEREQLIKNGWHDEGAAWETPDKGDPVYRLYNPLTDTHHYTKEKAEYERLENQGWRGEGEAFKTLTKDQAKANRSEIVTIKRAYNPNATEAAHNFTSRDAEQKNLIAKGWHDEGVAFYGYKPQKELAVVKICYAAGSKELANALRKKVEQGQSLTVKAKEFEGYRLISGSPEITLPKVDGNTTVTFEYAELANAKSLAKLKDKIRKTTRLVAADYSSASWERVKNALKSSYDVAYSGNALQKDVFDELTKLEKATVKLVRVKGLTATLQSVEQVEEKNFNPKGWQKFGPAQKKAQAVLADPKATQKQVNQAHRELKKGIDQLVYVNDLKTLYQTTAKLKSNEYTRSSWKVLADANKMAKNVLNDTDVEQAAVNSTFKNLQKAQQELQAKGDKRHLKTLVSQGNQQQAKNYTKTTWDQLTSAISSSQQVLKDEEAVQSQVDEQTQNLQLALDGLEKRGQVNELEKIYREAKSYQAEDYAQDTWSAFATCRKNAQQGLKNKKELSQAEVERLMSELKASQEALVKVEEKLTSPN